MKAIITDIPTDHDAALLAGDTSTIGSETVCMMIYVAGAAFFAGLIVWQLFRIRRLRRDAEIVEADNMTIVRTMAKTASFSFFGSIYIWREVPADEIGRIIAHEASHIRHRHSAERLAMEIVKAAMWWNPFVWIAARKLVEVEKFEADRDVINSGYEVSEYMNTIFKQLFGYTPEIANGLRDSLTKKRFTMMTTHHRSRHGLLRILGIVPCIIALTAIFGFTTKAATVINVTDDAVGKYGDNAKRGVMEVILKNPDEAFLQRSPAKAATDTVEKNRWQ